MSQEIKIQHSDKTFQATLFTDDTKYAIAVICEEIPNAVFTINISTKDQSMSQRMLGYKEFPELFSLSHAVLKAFDASPNFLDHTSTQEKVAAIGDVGAAMVTAEG